MDELTQVMHDGAAARLSGAKNPYIYTSVHSDIWEIGRCYGAHKSVRKSRGDSYKVDGELVRVSYHDKMTILRMN